MQGLICLWSGAIAEIPTGWALCDGTQGTPDLRDRFVVCAKQDDAGVAKTNITGALTVTGGTIEHNHNIIGGADLWSGVDSKLDDADHLNPYYALAFIMKL